MRYELVFVGAGSVRAYKIPHHKRFHASHEAAVEEARKVHAKMIALGLPVAAHPSEIYPVQRDRRRKPSASTLMYRGATTMQKAYLELLEAATVAADWLCEAAPDTDQWERGMQLRAAIAAVKQKI